MVQEILSLLRSGVHLPPEDPEEEKKEEVKRGKGRPRISVSKLKTKVKSIVTLKKKKQKENKRTEKGDKKRQTQMEVKKLNNSAGSAKHRLGTKVKTERTLHAF